MVLTRRWKQFYKKDWGLARRYFLARCPESRQWAGQSFPRTERFQRGARPGGQGDPDSLNGNAWKVIRDLAAVIDALISASTRLATPLRRSGEVRATSSATELAESQGPS